MPLTVSIAPPLYTMSRYVCCPCLAPALTDIYLKNADLVVAGKTILSQEGMTQGNALAMVMHALGVTPLIQAVCPWCQAIWFADDATAGGCLCQLWLWWDSLAEIIPSYGYYLNSNKTWLVVKAEYLPETERVFDRTGVCVTCTSKHHLGAVLGTRSLTKEHIQEKVKVWNAELDRLSPFAKSEPHDTFAAFPIALFGNQMYFLRTTEGIAPLLQPLEDLPAPHSSTDWTELNLIREHYVSCAPCHHMSN